MTHADATTHTPTSTLGRRLLWAGLATTILTVGLIIWADIPLATFLQGHRQAAWMAFFAFITDFASGFIWYPVALAGIGAAYVRHKYRAPNPAAWIKESRAWIFMIITMASSGTIINAVKLLVGRERPRFLFRDGTADFHPLGLELADCSFPSGHTQSIWAAMLALSFLMPSLRPVFFAVAILVSASRVMIGAHYAGDVVAGLYIAVAATLLWRRWFERNGIALMLRQPHGAGVAST